MGGDGGREEMGGRCGHFLGVGNESQGGAEGLKKVKMEKLLCGP